MRGTMKLIKFIEIRPNEPSCCVLISLYLKSRLTIFTFNSQVRTGKQPYPSQNDFETNSVPSVLGETKSYVRHYAILLDLPCIGRIMKQLLQASVHSICLVSNKQLFGKSARD